MCWNWQVSLCFVLFQAVSLSYLFYRNKYIDRWYVLVCLPFMGQEVVQFFQWAWGDIENATHFECTMFNKVWTKFLMLDSYAIPICVSIFAYKTSHFYPIESNKKSYYLWKYLLISQVILYPLLVILMMLDADCVTVGANGHQNWPPAIAPSIVEDVHWFLEFVLIGVYYYPPIVLVGIFYRPLWVAILPSIYAVVSLGMMMLIIGDEAWSLWCWSCACITVWVFSYAYIAEWMIKQYNNDDSKKVIDKMFGDNRFVIYMFDRTQEHLVKWGMINTDQQNLANTVNENQKEKRTDKTSTASPNDYGGNENDDVL